MGGGGRSVAFLRAHLAELAQADLADPRARRSERLEDVEGRRGREAAAGRPRHARLLLRLGALESQRHVLRFDGWWEDTLKSRLDSHP